MNDESDHLSQHTGHRPLATDHWRLTTGHWRLLEFDSVVSTNTIALSLADDPANHGMVVLAREQTAGRGQYGRTWLAPLGSSVLMSILLFPPPALRRPALLTAWAAVTVCKLCEHVTGLPARIKWPNDVLIQDRKVCGILIEQRARGPDHVAAVVGVGLNVTQSAETFAEAGLLDAASLAFFSAQSFDCHQIAEELLMRLNEEYHRLTRGELGPLENRWRQLLGLSGQVSAECVKETIHGKLVNVSFAGLELEIRGERICLQPEAVRHLERVK